MAQSNTNTPAAVVQQREIEIRMQIEKSYSFENHGTYSFILRRVNSIASTRTTTETCGLVDGCRATLNLVCIRKWGEYVDMAVSNGKLNNVYICCSRRQIYSVIALGKDLRFASLLCPYACMSARDLKRDG